MNKNIMKSFLFLFLGVIVGYLFIDLVIPNLQPFDIRRELVIKDMNSLIEESVEKGDYRCCIDPPCTMCFLGEWIWEDGICRCDDMIAQGQDDKVCPQCKKGLKEGKCKYAQSDKCELKGEEL